MLENYASVTLYTQTQTPQYTAFRRPIGPPSEWARAHQCVFSLVSCPASVTWLPGAASRIIYLRFVLFGLPWALRVPRNHTRVADWARSTFNPPGAIAIDLTVCETTGSNLIVNSNRPQVFGGYFVARSDTPFVAFETARNKLDRRWRAAMPSSFRRTCRTACSFISD